MGDRYQLCLHLAEMFSAPSRKVSTYHLPTPQVNKSSYLRLFNIISSLSGPFAFHLIYSNLWLCLREFEFISDFHFFIRKEEVKSQFWGSMHLCHLLFISKY